MTAAAPATWRRRADARWRRSIDAVVLLPAGAEDPLVLPGTAAAVWDLLAVPTTLDEVVTVLAEEYGTEPGAIAGDVTDLLARLEAVAAVERERP